jgi:hypothetical protein
MSKITLQSNRKFAISVSILDFFHATGYMGAVANALFPGSEKAQKAWLEDRCHRLNTNTAQRWVQFWQKIDLLGFDCIPAFSN